MGDAEEKKDTIWSEHKPTVLTMAFLMLLSLLFYGQWRRNTSEAMSAAKEFAAAARDTLVHQGTQDELEGRMLSVLDRSETHRSEKDLYLHLAISLFVAVLVIFLVELRSATRRKQEMREHRIAIAESVWKAVVRRMVPDTVVREIDTVLKSNAVRQNCRYTITLKGPYPGMPQDFLVLERKVVYTLVNVTNGTVDVPIRATISPVHAATRGRHTPNAGDQVIARNIEFKVGGVSELARALDQQNPLAIRYMQRMKGGEEVEVFVRGEEAVQTRDHYAVFMVAPVCGMTLRIDDSAVRNRIAIQDVQLNCMSREEPFKPSEDGVRSYSGALLPGQGFVLRWSERRPA